MKWGRKSLEEAKIFFFCLMTWMGNHFVNDLPLKNEPEDVKNMAGYAK